MTSSLFTLNQKFNQLLTTVDKLQTKITSTATTTLTSNHNLVINLNNMGFLTFALNMTTDIHTIVFQNPVINGNYKIYLQSSSPHILNKVLGANIRNNLNGNTVICGYFCVDIFYNGNTYFISFNNFT